MPAPERLVLRDVDVEGCRVDVEIDPAAGCVVEVGSQLAKSGAAVVDGAGGALLPGLHDHHLHVLATAAARRSVDLSASGLDALVRCAAVDRPGRDYLRAVGYHEAAHGPLDRAALDDLVPDRPVRVQHQSGALWVLNTAALAELGLPTGGDGQLLRCDDLLRERVPAEPLDLAGVGAKLASHGVTGLTDATPTTAAADLQLLADAVERGDLPQRVVVMTAPGVELDIPSGLEEGPVKVIVGDHDLPTLDDLADTIAAAHDRGRPVALHVVTRVAAVLAVVAWLEAGSRPGDRIEHGSVLPPDLDDHIARLGLTVVTQPGFVRERGDRYLSEVEPDDLAHLYRCASLDGHGIPVGGSTDAPYSDPNPWLAMQAAVDRTTLAGRVVGDDERVTPARALSLFLGDPARPGGAPRRVTAGAPADLCLLREPLRCALASLATVEVALVLRRGRATGGTAAR